jgi:hypothetical protein
MAGQKNGGTEAKMWNLSGNPAKIKAVKAAVVN